MLYEGVVVYTALCGAREEKVVCFGDVVSEEYMWIDIMRK